MGIPLDVFSDKIADFYRQLVVEHRWPIATMLQMVETIAKSEYAGLLYGATSHEVLLVSIKPKFEYHRDMLRIEPAAERLTFKYYESAYREAAMVRDCEGERGFEMFEKMVKWRRWIVRYNEAAKAE